MAGRRAGCHRAVRPDVDVERARLQRGLWRCHRRDAHALSRAGHMAEFVAARPLVAPVGTAFSYSSGTAVMLARIWQNTLGDPARALAWPREKLFAPTGMDSAVLEADA